LLIFHNPEIPRFKHRQSRDSGLGKWAGIAGSRDSGSRDWNPYIHRYANVNRQRRRLTSRRRSNAVRQNEFQCQ